MDKQRTAVDMEIDTLVALARDVLNAAENVRYFRTQGQNPGPFHAWMAETVVLCTRVQHKIDDVRVAEAAEWRERRKSGE
jgi:hypothetical protein